MALGSRVQLQERSLLQRTSRAEDNPHKVCPNREHFQQRMSRAWDILVYLQQSTCPAEYI